MALSGVLTAALAAHFREVQAIDVDAHLVSGLLHRFGDSSVVDFRAGDFFAVELTRKRYSVFANVPFSRTADVVRRVTEAQRPPEDAYLVVQAEAAVRFAGLPYGPESVASLVLKPW